ncbi:MAG: FkbM family methyltransferase [Acidobacteria bacterium]|nr:FkbM family methyltransferase [Acidobacteriota bacterium]
MWTKHNIRLGLVGGVVLVLMSMHQQVLGVMLKVTGRSSPHCDVAQVLSSVSATTRHAALEKDVAAKSRELRSDGKGYSLWETPLGQFWIPSSSKKEILFNVAEQLRNIYDFNGHGVKAGDIVIDGGANVGVYTRLALLKGAAKVVAIEPSPENLECLRRTFVKEVAEGKVIIYPKGIWDKDDVLTFYVSPTNSAENSFVRKMDDAQAIEQKLPLTTVDKMMDELELKRVDYIKLDIEGAERRALRGAKQTLAKYHPRMALCVYHLPDDPIEVPKAVFAAARYNMECGQCLAASGHVYPEVFFFY